MDNVDLSVLRVNWFNSGSPKAGHAVVLGTITRTWGSAPRPVPGSVRRDPGRRAGHRQRVSGGCIEDDLVDRVPGKAPWPPASTAEVVRYGIDAEDGAHASACPAAA